MIERIEVEKITCDGCGISYYREDDEELPLGYFINEGVVWIHGTGGTGTEGNHYFCKKACLVKWARNIEKEML